MGRRKKKQNNNLKNIGLGALVALIGIFGYLNYVDGNYKLPSMDIFYKHKNAARIEEPIIPQEPVSKPVETTKEHSLSVNQTENLFIVRYIEPTIPDCLISNMP